MEETIKIPKQYEDVRNTYITDNASFNIFQHNRYQDTKP